MNELQRLMGDSYKEDLTVEDITNFMKGKNLADLSTGNYVDVNKYNSEIKDLQTKLTNKETEIRDKMTDDEKVLQAQKDKDAEIERLTKLLSENTIATNKSIANSSLTESANLLGIKADDKDYIDFINNITSEDSNKTTSISQYVNKLIKDSYEKGKKDSVKNAMGDFGNQKGGSSKTDEIGKLGKELAQASLASNNKQFDYFKQN